MLVTLTVLAVITLADPPAPKEPPTKEELAAITERGLDLAVTMPPHGTHPTLCRPSNPRKGVSSGTLPARSTRSGSLPSGGSTSSREKFLIAYEATQGDKPDVFDVKEMAPPKEDTGFYLSAAKAIDTSLKDFVLQTCRSLFFQQGFQAAICVTSISLNLSAVVIERCPLGVMRYRVVLGTLRIKPCAQQPQWRT